MQKELIYNSLTFVRGVYACQTNKLFRKHLGVPWESLYHAYVRIFCFRHQKIVQCWLKQVKKETWSHSGRCLVCRQFEFFVGIPNENWLTEQRTRTINKKSYGPGANYHPSEWQANMRVSGEAVRGEGKEELSFSFPAPCSRVLFCVPLARDFSRYSLNGELACRLLRFSLL